MSKPIAKETKPVLYFVRFRREYYPLTADDLKLLRHHGVSVARIPESALTVLSSTLLRGVKVFYHTWSEVYVGLISQFKTSFPEGYAFKSEDNFIIIQSSGDMKKELPLVESRVKVLQTYMARYGFRVAQMTKDRGSYFLTRLVFIPDENIVPSLSFGEGNIADQPVEFKFSLSPSCRVILSKKKSPTGLENIKVSFEDRYGDTFTEAFSRAFNFDNVKKEDCEAGLNFFATLLSYHPASRNHGN